MTSLLYWAVALLLVHLASQALLSLGLVASQLWRWRRAARRAAWRRRLEELLARPDTRCQLLEMAARQKVLKIAARQPSDFLCVVESAMQTLSGPARRRIAELLEASAPCRQLLRQAAGPKASLIIRAVSALGRLDSPEARAAVRRALEHPSEDVRRAARRATVAGGEEDARREVLDGLPSLPLRERISLFQLVPAGAAVHDFLAEALASGDDKRILVALEFVLTLRRLLPVAVPAGLALSRNPEVRIRFFRALPYLRPVEEIYSVLEPGLHDPDWRVRAVAARACGEFRAESLEWRLLEMCAKFEDPAEAGHAARALAAFGGEWSRFQEAPG